MRGTPAATYSLTLLAVQKLSNLVSGLVPEKETNPVCETEINPRLGLS